MPTTRITGHQPQVTTTRTTATLSFPSSHFAIEHVTLEEVFCAYYDCRLSKRSKNSAVRYELDYEVENYRLWQELNTGQYEIGISNTFCVTKPRLREIFAASFRDRIVHHLIANRILPTIERRLFPDAYACRKGRGALYGAKRISAYMRNNPEGWVAKCDVRGFFMSIDKDVLWQMVEDVVREAIREDVEWWLALVHKIIFHRPEERCSRRGNILLWEQLPSNKSLFHSEGRGLPIGNLTSQIFANLYMSGFDAWMKRQVGDGRYGRYVDDFVIIADTREQIVEIIIKAKEWLHSNLHLELHPRKIYIQPVRRGLSFVGYIIKGDRLYCESRTIHNAMRVVESWNKSSEHTSQQRERFISRINSYHGLLRHGATYKVRRRLWDKIQDKTNLANINHKKIKLCKTS